MKSFVAKTTILLFLFFIISPSYIIVKAEQPKNYYRVIKEDAPLYESTSMQTILFYLQYTYYVNVIAENGDLYHVEVYGDQDFPSFIGYTKKDNLYKDNQEVTSPYPSVKVKTCTSSVLYTDTNYLNKQVYLFAERTYSYFGKNYDNANNVLYLIGYDDRIGYVKESSVYPFTIENHPNPLTFLDSDENSERVDTTNVVKEPTTENEFASQNTLIKVGILCSLIVAGGIGLYVVIRKKDSKPNRVNYYDENEYE